MEEKNINEIENETQTVTEEETVEIKKEEKKTKKKKIKNELLLKKGGVSVAVTALFIAAVVVFNVIIFAISNRVNIEYDFSDQKVNSLTKENVEYIKKVDGDVSVIVCCKKDDYVSYINMTAQYQNIIAENADYYEQTLKLLDKYSKYNKKIKIEFIDPSSGEFTKVKEQYGSEISSYGDIIVSSKASGNERHKVLTFTDVYGVTEDSTYAAYGYTTSQLSSNNIETALTGAVSYVLNNTSKKIALIVGHSSSDLTASYQKLLKQNNFEIEVISDKLIKSLSDDFAEIVIPMPSVDFSEDEINVISEFLENGGEYGKGLTVFADASAPYLQNLYSFLDDWGITVEEGKMFETNENNFMPGDPTLFGSFTEAGDKMCISGSNVPLIGSDDQKGYTVTPLVITSGSVIAVPKDTAADFSATDTYEKKNYATVIESQRGKSVVSADEKNSNSFVTVFSSSYFLDSEYNENQSVSNKNIALSVTETNCGIKESDISFVEKSITNESFADKVTASKATVILVIFMFVIPLALLGMGIYIYIKRRNAA